MSFLCVKELWLLNDFFQKSGFRIIVRILREKAAVSWLTQFNISKACKL